MVVADDFVVLKVPTFDLLIIPSGEHIRVTIGNSQPPNSSDMTCESQFELSRRQVPYLYRAVGRAGAKPLVGRIDCNGTYPPKMSHQYSIELPWWVPVRSVLSNCQSIGDSGVFGPYPPKVLWIRGHGQSVVRMGKRDENKLGTLAFSERYLPSSERVWRNLRLAPCARFSRTTSTQILRLSSCLHLLDGLIID